MSELTISSGADSVVVNLPDDELTLKRLRRRIENSMRQIRSTGAKVTIDADFGVAVLVLVEPQAAFPSSDVSWGKVTAPTKMWIDPDLLIAPRLREMQAAV